MVQKKYFMIVLLLCFTGAIFWSENMQVIRIINKNGEERKKEIASESVSFSLSTEEATKIEGLEKLTQLKKLSFYIVNGLVDLRFLENCKKLEILVIDRCTDITYLPDFRKLTNLRALMISVSLSKETSASIYTFDLSRNTKLEYLQIADCNLTKFPKLTNIPPSLKYVNFSGNLIESIDEDSLRALKNVKVFVADNLLQEKDYARYGNVGFSLEKMWKVLPPEFMETY